jgi:hypothetical protein
MEVRRMDKHAEEVLFNEVYSELCEQAPPPPADAGVEDMYDYQEWLLLEACRISEEKRGKKNG